MTLERKWVGNSKIYKIIPTSEKIKEFNLAYQWNVFGRRGLYTPDRGQLQRKQVSSFFTPTRDFDVRLPITVTRLMDTVNVRTW